MNTKQKRKVTLVEFLRSIKFADGATSSERVKCTTHFAAFDPKARTGATRSAEDQQLVRSAN
ncbi:MAG: hypothetical protein AAGI11_19270 [Pseudomonadota bacterium]